MIAAVPVASSEGAERLSLVCDEFHALLIDASFGAVGQYYDSFRKPLTNKSSRPSPKGNSRRSPNKTIAHAQAEGVSILTSPIVTPVTRMEPEWIARTSLNSRF